MLAFGKCDQLYFREESTSFEESSIEKSVHSVVSFPNESILDINTKAEKENISIHRAKITSNKRTIGVKFVSQFEREAKRRAEERARAALRERRKARKVWNDQHKDGELFADSKAQKEAKSMEKWSDYSNLGAKKTTHNFLRLRGQAGGARPQSLHVAQGLAVPASRAVTESKLVRKPLPSRQQFPPDKVKKQSNQGNAPFVSNPTTSAFPNCRSNRSTDQDSLYTNEPKKLDVAKKLLVNDLNVCYLRTLGVQTSYDEEAGGTRSVSSSSPCNTIIHAKARKHALIPCSLCTRATSPFRTEVLRKLFGDGDLQKMQSQPYSTENHVPSELEATQKYLTPQVELVAQMTKMINAVSNLVNKQTHTDVPLTQPEATPHCRKLSAPKEAQQSIRSGLAKFLQDNSSVQILKSMPATKTAKKWSESDNPKPLIFVKQTDNDISTHATHETSDQSSENSPDTSLSPEHNKCSIRNRSHHSTRLEENIEIEQISSRRQQSKMDLFETILDKLDHLQLCQKELAKGRLQRTKVSRLVEEEPGEKLETNVPLGIYLAAIHNLPHIDKESDSRGYLSDPDHLYTNLQEEQTQSTRIDISVGEEKTLQILHNVKSFKRSRELKDYALHSTGIQLWQLLEIFSDEIFDHIIAGMGEEFELFFGKYSEKLVDAL